MQYSKNFIQNHRRCTFWILAIIITSTAIASDFSVNGFLSRRVSAVQPQERVRLSVNDPRPVASAITELETRFNRIITYEDPPLVHPDDLLDVTESVRRDLHKYAPGKAPRVIIPRGGELNLEYSENDPVEIVLSYLLSESERVTTSPTFRIEETNGILHVIPQAEKGPKGETIPLRSILEAPVELPAQKRTGFQMLEDWTEAVSANSKKQIIIGMVPVNLLMRYKDDKGLSSQSARDALAEILLRSSKRVKLSWQLFYDPGLKTYAINIHSVNNSVPR